VPEPEAVRRAYDQIAPLLADVRRYVRDTLNPYAADRGYIIVDRTKDITSLSEKLESGRFPAWSRLDDLYGCTIVVPVSSHEAGVLTKLDSSFDRIEIRSRSSAKKAPDVFRFDGIRWYGRIPMSAASVRQPGVGQIIFEVQVVTAFEYAWKSVTHDLVYKGESVDWKKQRLAAQLKAAVEQIEVIINAFESASDVVLESPWPDSDMQAEIVARFRGLFDDGLVPETLRPKSWSTFAQNALALVKSFQRDPARQAETVSRILELVENDARERGDVPLPVSGTLFQYLVSIVARSNTLGNINRFTIVPSRELSEFYGIATIPQPFVFDVGQENGLVGSEPGERAVVNEEDAEFGVRRN
jgi:ppGpp synthetase/RelA/SpoT-type nucleotidyltranferase